MYAIGVATRGFLPLDLSPLLVSTRGFCVLDSEGDPVLFPLCVGSRGVIPANLHPLSIGSRGAVYFIRDTGIEHGTFVQLTGNEVVQDTMTGGTIGEFSLVGTSSADESLNGELT